MYAAPERFNRGVEERGVDTDAAIRQTDTDAAVARWSAVQKGYLQDRYIKHFLPRGAQLQPPRPPLINVGTYVRSHSIDALVGQWLALSKREGKKCQIVSLGAGSDTRFWRIAINFRKAGHHKDTLAAYVEVDFPENTTKKAMAIRKSPELGILLGLPEDVKIVDGGTGLHSPVYHLLAADLRKSPAEELARILQGETKILSPSLPTLLLFECVLVYMTPMQSSSLVQWFVDYFAQEETSTILGAIVYEMFGLTDAFGKVMLRNLKARHVDLPGVEPYPNFTSLTNRFLQHGFEHAHAITLRDYRRSRIDLDDQTRISELELLDELEELELVLAHYAVTWGFKFLEKKELLKCNWGAWGLGV